MRSEYTARINRVMDHIDAHLTEEMALDDLARVAGFSRFHFHRLFQAMVGETLGRFIARLRVERAASMLMANPTSSITEVALDCAFGSSAAFARAFKARFGVSASEWRAAAVGNDGEPNGKLGEAKGKHGKATRVVPVYVEHVNGNPSWRLEMKHEQIGEVKIEVRDLSVMTVAYVRHVGPYQGDDALFGRLFGALMRWAGPRGLMGPGAQPMSVYHDDPGVTDEQKLRTSVGITVPPGTEGEGEVGVMTLTGGATAVARFELHPSAYPAAWEAIYKDWLPDSGYQPDDRPPMELYHNDPSQHPEGKCVVDICVPVRPL